MSVPQETPRGGHPEQAAAPVLDPVTALRIQFGAELVQSAHENAPGVASADWSEWTPEAIEQTPRARTPGLVRVGTHGEAGLPVLVATLGPGSNHIIGDPTLLHRARPGSIKNLPHTEMRAAEQAEKEKAHQLNLQRSQALQREHGTAVLFTRNLMVRTAAAMHPGSVDFTVYNSNPLPAHQTSTVPELAATPLMQEIHGGNLPELLASLSRQIDQHAGQLQGHSLRQVLEEGGEQPFPWRMVALLGRGEQLDESSLQDLQKILRHGTGVGISLIIHGLQAEAVQGPLYHLRQRGAGWETPANGGLHFTPDRPAPHQAAALAAHAAVSPAAPVAETPHHKQLPPARRYTEMVHHFTDAILQTGEEFRHFATAFPMFNSEMLTALNASAGRYLELANNAAARPHLAAQGLHDAFRRHPRGSVVQLEAAALTQLMQHAPETPGSLRARALHGADAHNTVSNALPSLAQAVAITGRHGHEQLPRLVEQYVAQYLHDTPPAWLFQLVSDAALTRTGAQSFGLRRAVADHLEHTYGLQEALLNDRGQFADPARAAALTECELLTLYDFANADPDLQNVLAWHAQRAFDRVDPDTLPKATRPVYDAVMNRLEKIGRRYTVRERAFRAVGDALLRRTAQDGGEEDSRPAHGSPHNPRP